MPKKTLSPSELRAFRGKVSRLKKLGAVSKRTDARKQLPTKYMTSKVKKLSDVLEGRAVLVEEHKLRPDILGEYQRTGRRVNRRQVVPIEPGERLHVRRGMPELEREIARTSERRIVQRRVILPIGVENLEEFITDLRRRPEKWASDRGHYPPWVFGFTIYGNRSHQLFADPETLADELEKYIDHIDDTSEAWEHFELYAIDSENIGRWARVPHRGSRGRRRQRNRAGYKAIDHKMQERARRAAMSEAERNAERKRNTDRRREQRRALAAKTGRTQRGTKFVRPRK